MCTKEKKNLFFSDTYYRQRIPGSMPKSTESIQNGKAIKF